jgi:putative transposase
MRPKREIASSNGQTYFVTSNTAGRKPFFRHERWANLFIETLCGYRPERYRLHGFVLMPDHFHILITPTASLELAIQCVKGGFSFRAKKEFGWVGDIWIAGFSDHRVRDDADFDLHLNYIHRNPLKAGLVPVPEAYPVRLRKWTFRHRRIPSGAKPETFSQPLGGAAEAAPFQNSAHTYRKL